MKIKIKPVSVNACWQGRRFKTDDYEDYETELGLLLPNMRIPDGDLDVKITWGLSSKNSDIDNPTKPFLDVLQKRYQFNDKMIRRLVLEKELVKKGQEYIEFSFAEYKTKLATLQGMR